MGLIEEHAASFPAANGEMNMIIDEMPAVIATLRMKINAKHCSAKTEQESVRTALNHKWLSIPARG